MICIVLIGQSFWQFYYRIAYVLIIVFCHLLTELYILIQVLEFYIKYCCLKFIQAAVSACIFEHIFLLTAVVGKCSDYLCKLIIVGGNRSGISKRAKILARIETMTCGISY